MTPAAKAKAAYPRGATPRSANMAVPNRPRFVPGLDQAVNITVSNPVTATLARPTIATLIASQRVRVMLCVHARRHVPVSNSRATSGAPQNAPIMAGTPTRAVLRNFNR